MEHSVSRNCRTDTVLVVSAWGAWSCRPRFHVIKRTWFHNAVYLGIYTSVAMCENRRTYGLCPNRINVIIGFITICGFICGFNQFTGEWTVERLIKGRQKSTFLVIWV